MRSFGWTLILYDWCPYKKSRIGHEHTLKEDHMKTHLQVREILVSHLSKVTNPANISNLDF